MPTDAESLFGTDIDAIVDVPLRWDLCSGRKNLGNALARRLAFLRTILNAGLTATDLARVRGDVVAALEADPRVQSVASLDFSFNPGTSALDVPVTVNTAEGPFDTIIRLAPITTTPTATAAVSAIVPSPGPTLIYDNMFATEHEIANHGTGTPIPLTFTITGIPFNTFGTGTLRVVVTLDSKSVDGTGNLQLTLSTVPARFLRAQANQATGIGTSYATYVAHDVGLEPAVVSYLEITGPGIATNLVFSTFLGPPFFNSDEVFFKNVHVQVYSVP